MRRNLSFLLISVVFLVILTLYHSLLLSDKNFHLIFCDVGQGDGILIKTPEGQDIIVDGGPSDNSMIDCLSRNLPFWDREIDAVYMTHPDADHLTGLVEVVKTYNVKYFGMSNAPKSTEVYKELLRVLQSKKIPTDLVVRGDRVATKDGFKMETLWPSVEFSNSKSEETNDYSLVQYVTYKKFTALLTGDVASVYLNSLIPTMTTNTNTTGFLSSEVIDNKNSNNFISRIDVLKPPHHGSKTGVDEFTFQHSKPKLAVISVGAKNRYGHPSPEVLRILKENSIPYKDTRSGDVEIISDGEKWWIR